MTVAQQNPFPARAVTRFGVVPPSPANLRYMRDISGRLIDYLSNYPNAGGAIALSGAHGSGKTFALNWLAKEVSRLSSAPSHILYAKADSPRFIDVYKQLMLPLTRDRLASLLGEMVKRQALADTSQAAATAASHELIQRTGDIDPAYTSREIDPNEVYRAVREKLEQASESRDVARRVAAAITLLDDPNVGEPAFEWIVGRQTKLPNEALQTPLFDPMAESAADIVVAALETLAALYRFAQTPLIIMIDQMENLLAHSDSAAGSSTLKKLIEQVGGQGALLYLAGTHDGWRAMRRDAVPRFLAPEPIVIGDLTAEETEALLRAYDPRLRLRSDMIETFRALSAGNPREILQTAWQAFDITEGNLSDADAETLRVAATKSGTLQDRTRVAGEIVERLAQELGLRVLPAPWVDAEPVDRLIIASGGATLSVILAVTADRQDEARLGRRLTQLKRQSAQSSARSDLLVIAIGYSSEQVRSLLSTISRVIVFRESGLKDDLQKEFSALAAAPPIAGAASQDRVVASDPNLSRQLDALQQLLAKLEETRARADQEAAQRLSDSTAKLAAEENLSTEIRTRQQLRQGLDDLSDSLARGNIDGERLVMRGLLVANEAHVGDRDFDFLGSIYLDAVETTRAFLIRARWSSAENDSESTSYRSLLFRTSIIRDIRNALLPGKTQYFDKWQYRLLISIVIPIVMLCYAYIQILDQYISRVFIFSWAFLTLAVFFICYVGLIIFNRLERRYHRQLVELKELQNTLERR